MVCHVSLYHRSVTVREYWSHPLLDLLTFSVFSFHARSSVSPHHIVSDQPPTSFSISSPRQITSTAEKLSVSMAFPGFFLLIDIMTFMHVIVFVSPGSVYETETLGLHLINRSTGKSFSAIFFNSELYLLSILPVSVYFYVVTSPFSPFFKSSKQSTLCLLCTATCSVSPPGYTQVLQLVWQPII